MSNPLLSLSGVVNKRQKSIVEQFRDFNKLVIELLNKAIDIRSALKSAKISSQDTEKYNMIFK